MNRLKKFFSKVFPSNIEKGEIGSLILNIWLAQIFGVPFIGLKPEPHKLKIILLIWGVLLTTMVTFMYTAFELYDLVLNCKDLDSLTQNFCISLTHFTGAVKAANLLYKLPEVRQVIKKLEHVTKTYIKSDLQLEAFYSGEFENTMFLSFYVGLVSITGVFGIVMMYMNPAVVGQIFPYRVMLPSWMPQQMKLLYMGLSIFIIAIQIIAVDYLNVTIINQIRFQLNVLNLSFNELIVDVQPNGQPSRSIISFVGDPVKRLNSIIEHHVLLIDIRNETENIFNKPILWQFFTSLVIFAMTGFQATVRPGGSSAALIIYAYCGCIFCELFLYCWFGNEVSEQSKTLATSGFNSSWYNFDRRYCKSLLIFLTNAQRPFIFTAGGYMELSLPSFAGILSKSYSYIALLRQIYGN